MESGNEPDLEKDRGIVGRILFVDYQLPRENKDAGSYAILQEIKLIQSLGFKATFLPANLADLCEYKTFLEKNGVEVITSPFYLTVTDFLVERGREFDAVYVTRYNVLSGCIEAIRKYCMKSRLILSNCDLHFLRELRSAVENNSKELLEQAKQTQKEEVEIMRKADAVISYNDIEHSVIFSHTDGEVQPLKCPWVIYPPTRVIDTAVSREGLTFLGSFKHPPNKEGIEWFINNIHPFLSDDINLNIYGSGISSSDMEDLSGKNINIKGFVENVHDAFDPHRIFVGPLLSGAV